MEQGSAPVSYTHLFDTLVRTVNYDLNAENNQNIISVFLEGRTVCQGYACATKYLQDLLGIPCTIAVSYTHLSLMHGQYGISDIVLSMPAVVDAGGVEQILPVSLDEEERARLHASAKALRDVIADIEL